MTRLSPSHPRYRSLRTRATLARELRTGLVAPEGLIAHGRGEAFDYFLGERTTPSARRAERAAAGWLRAAAHPVLSVNGNVAALAATAVARVARAIPGLAVEVNLFHRTGARAAAVARALARAGVRPVLGLRPTARIPHLPSDRSRVDRRGIYRADVCLIPLEDGDRTDALRRMGKRVISIDLNPLSRTSRTADLPIVDELTRALHAIAEHAERSSGTRSTGRFAPFDAPGALAAARRAMVRGLSRSMGALGPPGAVGGGVRPGRGTLRRSRRTR
jgi:4-phosphopantoate--beta-alanine ligase